MHDGEYVSPAFLIPPWGRAKPRGPLAKWRGVVHCANTACMEELNCTVECNPLIGPQLFDAAEAIMAKKEVPKRIVVKEGVFDQSQAAAELPNRKY